MGPPVKNLAKELVEKSRTGDFPFEIFANSPIGIYVAQDGRFRLVNEQFMKITGFSDRELEGMRTLDIVMDEDRNIVRERAVKMLKGRLTEPYEYRIITKNGDARWILESVVSIEYQGERAVLGNFMDITENKKSIEALRESEARYRSLVEMLPDPVAVHSYGKVVFVNNAAVRLWGGTSKDEMLGMNVMDFLHPDYRDRVLERVKMVYQKGYAPFEEEVFITRHGREIYTEVAATRIMFQGEMAVMVVIRNVDEKKRINMRLERALEKMERMIDGTIVAMSKIVESRDPYTAGHHRRTAKLAVAIAQEMGYEGDALKTINTAALIHDIGKVYIPSEILTKPGNLTELEMSIIKTHPENGYDILSRIEFDGPVAEIVLQHHENLDGSGYPRGLKGDEILMEARILSVADVVEAISSHRPYRPSRGIESAIEEIRSNRGKKYDRRVVDVALDLIENGKIDLTRDA